MNRRRETADRQMRHEAGSITLLVAAVLVVLGVLVLGVADLSRVLVARERAQTAADAAALAAAAELALPSDETPEEAARDAASVNGADLVRCTCSPGSLAAGVDVSVDAGHLSLAPGVHIVHGVASAVVGGTAPIGLGGPSPSPDGS